MAGLLKKISGLLQTAAPLASVIPGVGPIAGAAMGMGGKLLGAAGGGNFLNNLAGTLPFAGGLADSLLNNPAGGDPKGGVKDALADQRKPMSAPGTPATPDDLKLKGTIFKGVSLPKPDPFAPPPNNNNIFGMGA